MNAELRESARRETSGAGFVDVPVAVWPGMTMYDGDRYVALVRTLTVVGGA